MDCFLNRVLSRGKVSLERVEDVGGRTPQRKREDSKGPTVPTPGTLMKSLSRKVEWEDGGDLMRLLNRQLN